MSLNLDSLGLPQEEIAALVTNPGAKNIIAEKRNPIMAAIVNVNFGDILSFLWCYFHFYLSLKSSAARLERCEGRLLRQLALNCVYPYGALNHPLT